MSQDFEYKLERQDGEQVSMSVTRDAITIAIPAPITNNDQEAGYGIRAMAGALKKDFTMSEITSGSDPLIITMQTPNGHDAPLAAVAANALHSYGVLKDGAANEFRVALDKAEHSESVPVAPEVSTVDKLNAISQAMKGVVQAVTDAVPSRVAHVAEPKTPVAENTIT